MTYRTRAIDDDIARRLAAYAAARLSPSAQASARMRAHVMEAAGHLASNGAFAAAPPAVRSAEPISFAAYRSRLLGRTRVLTALMAAALSVLLLAGAAFAANPGGPLYGLRMWVETVSLPSEPVARADADADRLDARLDEAIREARNGNGSAVAAALAAYREILDDALAAASRDEARSLRLEAALGRHQLVLSTLLVWAPEPARDALERAIDRRDEAARGIGIEPGDGNVPGDGNGASNGQGNGAAGGQDKPDVKNNSKPPNIHKPPHPRSGSERRPAVRPGSAKPRD